MKYAINRETYTNPTRPAPYVEPTGFVHIRYMKCVKVEHFEDDLINEMQMILRYGALVRGDAALHVRKRHPDNETITYSQLRALPEGA